MVRFKLKSASLQVRSLLRAVNRRLIWRYRFDGRPAGEASRIVPLDPVGEHDRPHVAIDAAITAALEDLPPRAREVFILSRVEGLTYREIADDLRIPRWLVRRAMRRAIADLYAAVSDAQNDGPA